ncbi:MAG: dihydrolipoyllysine-residue succinyltransferase [Mariprofundaceae bacterium]|nr:dihydrolipoyllysine-residue succinyltransferase [Mariprofundaceae bacterium]
MMFEIKVPSLGESESEATLISWLKAVGDDVLADDIIAEIESDKITMEITATEAGVLSEQACAIEDTVEPGQVIGLIDTSKTVAQPAATTASAKSSTAPTQATAAPSKTPVKEKVKPIPTTPSLTAGREQTRIPMTRLRKRIASHLKEAQNTAAMLTTFNEVNMQPVMDLRSRYKADFERKHGCKLGFMSFFIKACAYASAKFPSINAYIDGDDVLYHNYIDMGVAVATDSGVLVPVLRDVGLKSFAEIEQGIIALATKARTGGLLPDELKGGTFSITNGGTFGSMLSTPIINTPQSAILGMHSIQKRVVVEHDQMVIRPMMYLALSYDHRLIDGKEAVQFLVAVKDFLEQPGLALLDI